MMYLILFILGFIFGWWWHSTTIKGQDPIKKITKEVKNLIEKVKTTFNDSNNTKINN